MSNDVTLETLAQRLIALERQNRRLKKAFAGTLVGALVILVVIGAKAQGPATAQGNPLLTFFDRSGKPRLRIGLGARGGPTLETIDENGKTKDFFGPPYARPLTQ